MDEEAESTEEDLVEETRTKVVVEQEAAMFPPVDSVRHRRGGIRNAVPLWLITFTDIMALMLTFFVLLYAMSVPQEEKWEEISTALSSKFTNLYVKPFNTGSQDVISIDKISKSQALDLGYLQTLVKKLLKARNIENVVIFQNGKRLVISLPSELLFKSGRADINFEGKKVLFQLGGALSRVKNRIEIAGHTDPVPITKGKSPYKNNWELSLARSAAVAAVLKEVGYSREIAIRGLSSARFDEMSSDVPEKQRRDMSRRVDIILMNDSGFKTKFYSLQ